MGPRVCKSNWLSHMGVTYFWVSRTDRQTDTGRRLVLRLHLASLANHEAQGLITTAENSLPSTFGYFDVLPFLQAFLLSF